MAEKKITKKAKLEAFATIEKTWQVLSNLCNVCLLFSSKKKYKLIFYYQKLTFFTLLVWNLRPMKVPSLFPVLYRNGYVS